MQLNWQGVQGFQSRKYKCGFCDAVVASNKGFFAGISHLPDRGIYICPHCLGPTFFDINNRQLPGIKHGDSVDGLPEDILAIYEEASVVSLTLLYIY